MHNRTEVIERLREAEGALVSYHPLSSVRNRLIASLREATKLLEGGESRTEYRVVARTDTDRSLVTRPMSRERAEVVRDSYVGGILNNVRIQHRAFTRTPWTDLEEAEDAG